MLRTLQRVSATLAAIVLIASQGYAADDRSKTKAPAPRLRDVEVPYELGTTGVHEPTGTTVSGDALPVEVGPNERFMSFNVLDWTGRPVRASIATMREGNPLLEFCGGTEGLSIPVPSDTTIYFWLDSGTCDSGLPAVATHGKIEITFGNRWFVAQSYKEWAES